jgi:D-alanyl-lipoteichoic acid acyltransferase DltB (MBOAT superfamily)
MSFITWQYLLFLPLVLIIYWQLPGKWRLVLLLAASYFFYACWDVRFLALVLTTTIIDYICALSIEGKRTRTVWVLVLALLPAGWLGGCSFFLPASGINLVILAAAGALGLVFFIGHEIIWRLTPEKRPRFYLILSIGFCLGILGFFKYFGFFLDSAHNLLTFLGLKPNRVLLQIILPVGISFYTFQSLGYVIDVYRGHSPACSSLLTFATYDAFFPQMVAGPIERGRHLIPQLEQTQVFNPVYLQDGLRLILVGFFKKVFVADNCALLANYVFAPQTPLNGYWAVLGVVAFAFQIYGDFSGYTDIARGSAKLLGVDLAENFRFPYFARNPSEFWGRWHISLSTWFRDYLYIPLGGNRGSKWETVRNLAVTMLLAGLWHGANWIFVVWGAYHGLLLILYRVVPALRSLGDEKSTSVTRGVLAMALMWIVVLGGWAIFRSANLHQLGLWLAALGQWQTTGFLPWASSSIWLLLHVAPLLLLQILTWKYRDETSLGQVPWPVRGVVYALMLLLIVSSTEHDTEFIYFQF